MLSTSSSLRAPVALLQAPIAQLALLALTGGLLLFVTGFSSADLAHSLAHDARHAMGLPCH